MAHTYDLLLQAPQPGDPAPVAELVTALNARGAVLTPDGRGSWKLPGGEVTVEVLLEEGAVKGLDLRVPLLDRTELLEATVKELVDVTEAVKARLTDPQRGDSVTLTSLGAVVDEYLRMARYAGEYGGVGGALGLTSYVAAPEEESTTLRWLLIVAVFALALWAGWRTLSTIYQSSLPPDEPPGAVDAAPKVPRK